MPTNRQQAYIEIGISAVPVATSVISLFIEAEAVPAFFAIAAGVGAGLSLAAAPALIFAAVALAVVDEKTVSEIRTSVGQVAKVTSPGFVFSVPLGAVVTPQDPTLFASAVGPGLDLFAGALSPSGFDQFQAAQQSFIGFGTWFSDMQKFAAPGSSAKPSAPSAPSGTSRESGGGYSSFDEFGTNNSAGSGWNSGGFAHDSALPGGNETPDFSESSPTPDSTLQTDMMDLPGYETGLGAERSASAQAEDEVEAQNNAAEASPYSDEESQAAEDAAAAEQESENTDENEDPDNDDDTDED